MIGPRTAELFEGLPGADLIRQGLADLSAGTESVPALLVATGAPRLQEALGDLDVGPLPERPELRLYRLLCDQHAGEAYSQYNALLRRLSSFCRALETRSGVTPSSPSA